MARKQRVFREWQHARDGKGRFAKRGAAGWVKRAGAAFEAALPEHGTATRAGDRPRISRVAKGAALFQAHTDGARPSPRRIPKAVKTAAPAVKNLAAFNAPDVPKKRTPRPASGAAAFIEQRRAEQAPHLDAMRQARTAPETVPVVGAEAYAGMRRHTLLALARDAKINIRGKTNTQIANEMAEHDARVKADRAAKLNPGGVGASDAGSNAAFQRAHKAILGLNFDRTVQSGDTPPAHELDRLNDATLQNMARSAPGSPLSNAAQAALDRRNPPVDTSRVNPETGAMTERETKLAAKRIELEAAQKRVQAEMDWRPSGGMRTKSFGVRGDANIRRGAQAYRDVERLEREIAALERPEVPKKAVTNDVDGLEPGDLVKMKNGLTYKVAKVNAKSVKVVVPSGMDDLMPKSKIVQTQKANVTAPKAGAEPRVDSNGGGMTKRQAAKLQAEQDTAERERQYQVTKAERDAQEAVRRAEHEAELEAKRAAMRAKTPAGVRPADGRPGIGTITGRNRNPLEKWELGNTPGTAGSAPNMVISPVGHIDNRTANARIMNPLTPDGPYRYEIRDESTGEIIEAGEDRDLDKVYVKANRIMSRSAGGGMARTPGKSTRFEARTTERPKDSSRGDFGKGPFYEHTVVEIDQDGNETVRVKTGSAAKAEAHAVEMNTKERAANPRTPTTTRGRIPRDTKIQAINAANAKATPPAPAKAARKVAPVAPAEPQPTFKVRRDPYGSGLIRHQLIQRDPDGTETIVNGGADEGKLIQQRRRLEAEQGPVIPSAKLEAEEAKLRARLDAMRAKRAGNTRKKATQSELDVVERLQNLAPQLARSRREERAASERANPRGLGGMTGVDPAVLDQLIRDNLSNGGPDDRAEARAAEAVANGTIPYGIAVAALHATDSPAEFRRALGLPKLTSRDKVVEVDASEVRLGDIVNVGGLPFQVTTITGAGNTRQVSGRNLDTSSLTNPRDITGRIKLRRPAGGAAPKADAAQVAAPARSRISPDAKRGALTSTKAKLSPSDEADLREELIDAQHQVQQFEDRRNSAGAAKARTRLAEVRARMAEHGVEAKEKPRFARKPTVDTPRVNRQDGGASETPTTEATMARTAASTGTPQLGVTESSKGRTTTVTLPDGSTAQRTSKTMAYSHAVIGTTDQHANARDKRTLADRHDAYAKALEAWIADGGDMSKLKRLYVGGGSYNDQQAGLKHYGYYLPGFEPTPQTSPRGDKYHASTPGAPAVEFARLRKDGTSPALEDWEKEFHGPAAHRERVVEARKNAAELRKEAAKLEAGPQHSHHVARWSQRADTAHAAIGSPEVNAPNTRYQVIGVGGVADKPGKPTKKVPTAEEKAAALEAKKADEKARQAKSDQDFVDRTRAGVEQAIDRGDDPEDVLRSKNDKAIRFLAKSVGAKLPRKPQTNGMPAPLDHAEARKLIVEAIRKARGAEGKA